MRYTSTAELDILSAEDREQMLLEASARFLRGEIDESQFETIKLRCNLDYSGLMRAVGKNLTARRRPLDHRVRDLLVRLVHPR